MKKNFWLIVGLAVVVYLSGAVTGFFLDRLTGPGPWNRRPGPPPSADTIKRMMSERIAGRLELNSDQRQAVAPAIDRWFEEMETLRRGHAPEYLAVFTRLFDRINAVLTPQQKPEFQRFCREFAEFHVRGNAGPPPPMPPGRDENTAPPGPVAPEPGK